MSKWKLTSLLTGNVQTFTTPETKDDLNEIYIEITEMKAMLVDLKAQIEVFTERRKYETWRA